MEDNKKITILKNGPYVVSGSVPLSHQTIKTNEDGESTSWVEGDVIPTTSTYSLCRCGGSNKKPFCDGTHAKIEFDGTETAVHDPIIAQAKLIQGPEMQLADAKHLCASARFCDPNGKVWNQVKNTTDPDVRSNFIRQVGCCPSGRLIAIDNATGKSIEPTLPQSIGAIQDPHKKCSGPLWIRGGIPIVSSDGEAYEIRNRVTLCRCGKSKNKPFCNGAHASFPKFHE